MNINSSNIPGNTPVTTLSAYSDHDYLIHAEAGPIFDSDLQTYVFVNCAIRFVFDEENADLNLSLLAVFKNSFMKAYQKAKNNPEISSKQMYEITGAPLTEIFSIKYAEVFRELTLYLYDAIIREVNENIPEHNELLKHMCIIHADDVLPKFLFNSEDDEDAVPVDVSSDCSGDGDYTLTAISNPVKFDCFNCDTKIKAVISYDINNPEDIEISDYILFADENGMFPDDEWELMDETDSYYDLLKPDIEELNILMVQEIFKVIPEEYRENFAEALLLIDLFQDDELNEFEEDDFEEDYFEDDAEDFDDEDDEDDKVVDDWFLFEDE